MSFLGIPSSRPLPLQALGLLIVICTLKALYRFFEVRIMFRRLRAQGYPVMQHSFLFGHLPILLRLYKGRPQDMHVHYIPQLMMENWQSLFPDQQSCPALFYVDLWPMGPPTIFTIDPSLAAQSQSDLQQVHHHPNMLSYLNPLTQNLDIVSAQGAAWRSWRSRLSYGFAPKNITALVPTILDEVSEFCDILRAKAGTGGTWGPVFPLEPVTTNLSFDIIVRACLDLRLHEQTSGQSPLRRAMVDQLSHMLFEYNILTLPQIINPVRHWKMARNTRVMRDQLLPDILARLNSDISEDEFTGKTSGSKTNKTVVDLAVQALRREGLGQGENKKLDTHFAENILANLKAFIFAGHDTTAATLCWVLHCLAFYPHAAATLRAELDSVLGSDPADLIPQLRANPHLLHQLPYTHAFVKETIRLYPSAAVIRVSQGEFVFRSVPGENKSYPTKGFMLFDAIIAGMRYDGTWARPNEFLPERWLAAPGDELYVGQKSAWRPFGLGPRQCVGQELAMTELKLVLIVVAREWDVECAWEEWDTQRGYNGPRHEMHGHRCYQVGKVVPHLSDGMPVHVRIRGA